MPYLQLVGQVWVWCFWGRMIVGCSDSPFVGAGWFAERSFWEQSRERPAHWHSCWPKDEMGGWFEVLPVHQPVMSKTNDDSRNCLENVVTMIQGDYKQSNIRGGEGKKSFICLEDKSMSPHQGNTIYCSSSKRLTRLHLRPLKGFLSWHSGLQAPSTRLVRYFQNYSDTRTPSDVPQEGPRTPSWTIDTNLDCANRWAVNRTLVNFDWNAARAVDGTTEKWLKMTGKQVSSL